MENFKFSFIVWTLYTYLREDFFGSINIITLFVTISIALFTSCNRKLYSFN